MADQTVKQLAETINVAPDKLLQQMGEAGLPQRAEEDSVSDDDKKKLLTFLRGAQSSEEPASPRKITLRRRSTNTLKTNKTGRGVKVETRRKRTYVKREPAAAPEQQAEAQAPQAIPEAAEKPKGQLELEAEKSRADELRRQEAEEETRREAERKREEEEERRRAEQQAA